jgi:predicted KAP-like P-loop ATPase
MADGLKDRIAGMTPGEKSIVMDRLLDRARQEQEWGVPGILEALLVVCGGDPTQGSRLATFLIERPPSQVKPSIVPKISDQPWSTAVFKAWNEADVSITVKRALKTKV